MTIGLAEHETDFPMTRSHCSHVIMMFTLGWTWNRIDEVECIYDWVGGRRRPTSPWKRGIEKRGSRIRRVSWSFVRSPQHGAAPGSAKLPRAVPDFSDLDRGTARIVAAPV